MPRRPKGMVDKEWVEYRNKFRKINYGRRNFGTGKRQFTDMEIALIIDNPFENDTKLAKVLKRSVQSIQVKRCRVKQLTNSITL